MLSRWSWTYIYLPYFGAHTSLPLFLHLCEASWCFLYEKHTAPPQVLLSGLYMPCCVKGEDRSRRWSLSRNTAASSDQRPWLRTLVMFLLLLYSDSLCSSRPLRLVQYSCGRWKPCHCVVSRQQLRDFTIAAKAEVDRVQVAELLSQHYNYNAPMIQLYSNKAGSHMTPPVTWCRHSKANVNNRNDCVSFISCTRENKLTLRWPWLKSGGDNSQSQPEWAYRWAADYESHKLRLLVEENKVCLIKADSALEKQAIMRRSSVLCHWQCSKQKALLSSPAGGLFFSFLFLWGFCDG